MSKIIDIVRFVPRVTLQQVRDELVRMESQHGPRAPRIFMARETKFWCHYTGPVRQIVPISDVRGQSVGAAIGARYVGPQREDLDVITDWRSFLEAITTYAPRLRFGVATFMAAHADNCRHAYLDAPWSAREWASHDIAIERARAAEGKARA